MSQCVIIADDLTGANASGVLLQKLGYQTYTVMDTERLTLENYSECDCILYPTDSRGQDPCVAYNRVYNVANLLKQDRVQLYSKRIDSTLRGNIGSETDALLDALGEEYTAICAPCFPQSGRIVAGGYLLVHSVPLHKTEAAIDPKTPVHTPDVAEVFNQQSKYKTASLFINDLRKGKCHLMERIKQLQDQQVRTILFDCTDEDDLDLIAEAVIESKIPFISVDPGPFTAALARKIIPINTQEVKKKILAVVGSVNPVAKIQMEEFLKAYPVHNIFVKTEQFIKGKAERTAEINRIVEDILENYDSYDVFSIIGDGIFPENRIDFNQYKDGSLDDLCNCINDSFADITHQIIQKRPAFQGLYTSGGDITVAVSKRFHASGIKLQGEVIPLAAYGEFINGDFPRMKVVTKGGMVGDSNAMKDCIQYIKNKINE